MNQIYKNPFNWRQALKCAFIASLIINVILVMGILYPNSSDVMRFLGVNAIRFGSLFSAQFIGNFILFYLLFLFNFRLVRKGDETKHTLLMYFGGSLLVTVILSTLLSTCQWFILGVNNVNGLIGFIVFNLVKDMLSSFVVVLITITISLAYNREQDRIANQRLVIENIKTKYEALKNQLDPHFLFNSLNTLNGLIGIDEAKAHEFVDNLSSVFRYTFQHRNIVHLQNEKDFVDAYFTMLQIRYGDNIAISYDIEPKYLTYFIMPVSLQLLVENAVKHNTISNKKKLEIIIKTTEQGDISVTNWINPKAEKSFGGIGLANLIERYKILFKKNVEISEKDGFFKVEIPLLKEIDKTLNI